MRKLKRWKHTGADIPGEAHFIRSFGGLECGIPEKGGIKMETCSYEIMHGEKITAKVDTHGHCRIYELEFLPFSL